jgi:hypothetical protein
MAVTNAANGTTAALTLSTPATLTTQTTPGVYVLTISLANMASGDTVTVTAQTKVLSGSTARVLMTTTFTGAQTVPAQQSLPVVAEHEVAYIIEQTAGTGRAFAWSVASVG